MKFIYLFSLLLVLQGQQVQAQLSISPNQTATFLANKLVATSGTLGVTVSNAVLTCDSNGNGTFSGSTNLSISDGIVLGTGDVLSNSATSTFGLNGHAGDFASASFGTAGDTQLGNVIGATTYDACVLEMDLQPVGSFMEFEYIFGSEEYPSFNCTPFNDVFAFFISGPGISVPQNIALLPGTNVPVSINSINDSTSTSGTPCAISSSLYVPNTDTFTTMNGFTQSLTAHINVTPGSVYHLKLAIADVMDAVFNSYVLLKANSLKSGNTVPTVIPDEVSSMQAAVWPTTFQTELQLVHLENDPWFIQLLDLNGSEVYHTRVIHQESIQLNLPPLPAGLYLIKMINEETGKHHIEKLIHE